MGMTGRLLIVDDDWDFLELMKARLTGAGFQQVRIEDDPLKAAALIQTGEAFDIALIDMTMPEMSGLELLDLVKNNSPRTECIMVTAVNDVGVAVRCLRKGAYDYLVKPISEEDLVFSLRRTLEKKRLLEILDLEKSNALPVFSHPEAFQAILTRSPAMMRLLKEAELHAGSDVPILITGESGTGKELLARAVHTVSPRSRYPFMPVNMAAVSASLFEAEFFGHTRGAFTGAEKERVGYLKHANHGTLFLDEIGNLPQEMQGKLLRVLQDGEYTPVGSSLSQKVDVRIVAATNEDLESLISERMFRKDLYYRLCGHRLQIPPLRERPEDLPVLLDHFLEKAANSLKKKKPTPPDELSKLLAAYHFPGNIRELESMVYNAVSIHTAGKLSMDAFKSDIFKAQPGLADATAGPVDAAGGATVFPDPLPTIKQVDRMLVDEALRRSGGNQAIAAMMLGITRQALNKRLKKTSDPA